MRRQVPRRTSAGAGAALLVMAAAAQPSAVAAPDAKDVPPLSIISRPESGADLERALLPPPERSTVPSPGALLPHPEDSSKSVEGLAPKLRLAGKVKDCCGYPLGLPGSYKMTYYWLAYESEYANEPEEIDIYTKDGFLIGRFPRVFVFELKLEGTGVLRDGRILNYDRPCPYGIGTCFKELDRREHPAGKGAGQRALVPFRSVAIDPRFVPLGTPLYIPELRGLPLPALAPGQVEERHDGCVRADDTGGGIRRREVDLFVGSYPLYRAAEMWLLGDGKITPYLEEPRCDYLRYPGHKEGRFDRIDPGQDRRSEATDWAALHPAKGVPKSQPPGALARKTGSKSSAPSRAKKAAGSTKSASAAGKSPRPARKTATG